MKSGEFTAIVPYFNEKGFIEHTLESLLSQEKRPYQLILVDNASSDGSEDICRRILHKSGIPEILYLKEHRPGKIFALEAGCSHIDCEYVLTCDADVVYPPHFLALAYDLFQWDPKKLVAVMGQYVEGDPDSSKVKRRLQQTVKAARRHPKKCLTGGAGHVFKTEILKKAGGFDSNIWSYVLLDHEIMHRVLKFGRSIYHPDLWLIHTDRRGGRKEIRWNLWERLLYRYSPHFLGDWYFYRFLAPRLKKRKKNQLLLRQQPWQ